MTYRRWRMTEVFNGPVQFGSDDEGQDITFYTATADSLIKIDASSDEIYMDGVDFWLKDDDQLEFGDSSDIVVDWDNSNKRLLFNVDADGKVEFNRNRTSGATSTAVVYIKQDNANDDQAALQVVQDAADADALDVDGWASLGYITTSPSGSPSTGSVKVIRATDESKFFLAVRTSGGFRYIGITSTTTA